ncbi:MAG: S8 family serine peptidase [archaeon]
MGKQKNRVMMLILAVLLYSVICYADDSDYYLIVFDGPIMQEWKDTLSGMGVVFSNYVPDYSFVVSFSPLMESEIENLDFVASVSPYAPKFRYSQDLKKKSSSSKSGFYVLLHDGADDVMVQLSARNITSKLVSDGKLRVDVRYSDIDFISSLEGVSWVEEVPRYVLVNDQAAIIVSANTSWDLHGLSGLNQVVAISDSGIDTGFDDNMSDDFFGKIIIFNWIGTSADDVNGHGTHTTGSLAGSGNYSDGAFKGMAYNSNIVFQAIGDDSGTTSVYPPSNLSDLFIEAYNNGARVHSNSWGSTSNLGDYVSDSQTIDDFMWNYTDFLVVFAAGNAGSGLNTVEFPSTAKNGLSIGATENNRPAKGGSSDNIDEVASFSSRGPCDDGRVKPDLVVPGTAIVSSKSSLGVTSCTSSYESNSNYSYCQGTSMATPISAGVVALVQEHYNNLGVSPSAALVKAVLINGAMDIGYGIPSNHTGWGRINLTDSLFPSLPRVINYTDYSSNLSTSESVSYNFTVYNDSVPLKITLVWTDYPGEVGAAKELVNDLNLVVTASDGSVFNGNDVMNPFNDEYDDTNNVEQVNVSNVSVGSYLVNVSAFNIPNGPQGFALVVSGAVQPLVTLITGNDFAFTSNPVTLNFSVSDAYNSSNCSLFIDDVFNDSTVMSGSESYFQLSLDHGSYNWSVQCDDGSFNAVSDTNDFVVDLSPTVTIDSPGNVSYPYTSVEFNFSVQNVEACWYDIGGGNVSLDSCSNITFELNETSYSLYLFANYSDGFENYSSVDFGIDLTYPLVSLVSPSNSSTWSSLNNVNFVFNVTDSEISNCSLIVNDAVAVTNDSIYLGQNTITHTLSNANYNWSVSCSDLASNTNSSETYSLAVSYSASQNSNLGGGGGGGSGGGGAGVSFECQELWQCAVWSECDNRVQTRVCTDMNGCGTAKKKPVVSRICGADYTLQGDERLNKTAEPTGAAVSEVPKTVQIPRVYPYVFSKVYFYGPLIIILSIILAYALLKRVVLAKKQP